MQKSNLVASGHYALRPRGSNRNDPLVQVTFLGKARGGKVKVRFEGGESAGLEEWVATRSLACKWGERKEMLRDDEAAVRLIEIDSAAWDRVRQEAIFLVFEASGEETGFGRTWTTTQAQAVRLWSRAGLPGSPLTDVPVNFVDRYGLWHLSFETALKAAKNFASREPEPVELNIEQWKIRLNAESHGPGGRDASRVLRRYVPVWALARSWTVDRSGSADQEVIKQLNVLVRRAVSELRAAGSIELAAELEQALGGA